MTTATPVYLMLVGLPGSGKTTWRHGLMDNYPGSRTILAVSSDDFIDQAAEFEGKTYSEVFAATIDDATACADTLRSACFRNRWDVVDDRTNLTAGSRRKKLAQVPGGYRKVAVYFEVDEITRQQRLRQRPRKIIPEDVDDRMRRQYQRPMVSEGFDDVVSVDDFTAIAVLAQELAA